MKNPPGFFIILALLFVFITSLSVAVVTEHIFISRMGKIRDATIVTLTAEAGSLKTYIRQKTASLSPIDRIRPADNYLQIYDAEGNRSWQVGRFSDGSSDTYIKLSSVQKIPFVYIFKY